MLGDPEEVKKHKFQTKHVSKVLKHLKADATQGNAHAQLNLGNLYYSGVGVAKDEKKAVENFQLAAAQGHALAQYSLGECYVYGTGVAKDEEKAVE